MKAKIYIIIFALLIGVLFTFYIIFDESYQKSLEARFFYVLKDYNSSYKLAKESYELDKYNKMAFTILTQSQNSLKYIDYINEGSSYLKDIESFIKKTHIDKADNIRIKFRCEIMIDSYKALPKSDLIDDELIKQAKAIHERFIKMYQELY